MMKESGIYFSGLNGIRAIAAMSVVVSHITLVLGEFGLSPHLFGTCDDNTPKGLMLARYGVSIFFVLSGFLITWLLLNEKEKGKIQIKKFYLRRILRIWPLYYFYLAIAVSATLLSGMYMESQALLLYIFYAANIPYIIGTTIQLIGHYWSLGVEEQFYMFWPWLVRIKTRSLLSVLMVLISLFIGIRLLLHYLTPGSLAEEFLHITRFHNMMIGGIGAIWYHQSNRLFLKLTDNRITQSISWLILFLVLINQYHIASVIDNEVVCIVALCLIIGQIRVHHRVLNLETPVLNFLGRISYGIYVYHPIIIFFGIRTLNFSQIQSPFNYIFIYLIILSGTILTAYLSYTFFEIHFLNLKKRFEVVRSLKS